MKVFISSTFLDLEDHRAEVIKALRTSGNQPIDMETFGARSSVATELCYREIDLCDVFVGVYAHRYGYCPGRLTKSITELEFDYATKAGKDRLVFLVDRDTAWLPKFVDDGVPKKRLSSFKKRLAKQLVVGRFSTPPSLATLVVASLSRLRGEEPGGQLRSLETLLRAIRDSKSSAHWGRKAGLALIPGGLIVAAVAAVALGCSGESLIVAMICCSVMWAFAAWIRLQARDCINGCQITEVYLTRDKYARAGRQASLTTCIKHLREVIAEASRQDAPTGQMANSTP